MFKLTLKNILGKKLRYLLTTIAVVVAVSFVVGVFVLTDSLRASFDALAADITGGTDLVVRHSEVTAFLPLSVPDKSIEIVRSVDGVASAEPVITTLNKISLVKDDGELAVPAVNQAPRIGINMGSGSRLSNLFVVEGRR
ncbi:MAG: hypothetical protein V3V01_07880, partial [Acidimicrobiales bacterium]